MIFFTFARINSFVDLPLSFGSSSCREAFLVGFTAENVRNTSHKILLRGKSGKGGNKNFGGKNVEQSEIPILIGEKDIFNIITYNIVIFYQ